ncbi:monooxygenase, flavin-binding family [Candidatus Rhodobacter oscarellae]|uniref:Trimethylamine monooxygenase n=2 Tax=Candidatus Rhodobacter oscarellae TaxID=1675527 RepID=A0A0J9EA65_9RHOB|nr:monooxygenase, flavin-binding family [Candidatus Rhodobacter lobularis]
MPQTNLPVCVIGAGPAGLATARALRAKGLAYRQFDAGQKVGGIWDIERDGSPMYDSAHFISSKTMSGFAAFPMPDHYPDYPSNAQIQSYIEDFASTNDLASAIAFETKITDIEKLDGGTWRVTTDRGETTEFLGVVCATGTQWHPKLPDLQGQFDGEIIHSNTYRSTETFKGRRVLIIGAGNSGCDIACDAAANADAAFISMRRGYHFIPKHVFGKPADLFDHEGPNLPLWLGRPILTLLLRMYVGDVTRLGLPKPDHKLFESHPILNSQILHYLQHGDIAAKVDVDHLDASEVVFKDGSRETVDLIVCATGYSQRQSFARDYFEYRGDRPNMHLQIFNRAHRNLFGISHIETNSGAFKMFDQMAFLIANYLRDQIDGAQSAGRMDAMITGPAPDLSGGIKFVASDRHQGYVDSDTFKRHLDKVSKSLGWRTLSQEDLFAPRPQMGMAAE